MKTLNKKIREIGKKENIRANSNCQTFSKRRAKFIKRKLTRGKGELHRSFSGFEKKNFFLHCRKHHIAFPRLR